MLEIIDHDSIREIRMARPPVNALNPDMIEALDQAHRDAVSAGVGAIVLSGSEGMYSAGLDVPSLVKLDRDALTAFWERFFGLMQRFAESPVPMAAGITGHSPAGGAVLALFCDYRVGTKGDFRIGLNEVEVGLPVPEVILRAMGRLIGPRNAERLCVEGRLMDPGTAHELGFLDELVDPNGAVEAALAWCRRVTQLPSNAMSATRRMAREDLARLFDDVDEATYRVMCDVWFSDETQKTLQALLERLSGK